MGIRRDVPDLMKASGGGDAEEAKEEAEEGEEGEEEEETGEAAADPEAAREEVIMEEMLELKDYWRRARRGLRSA